MKKQSKLIIAAGIIALAASCNNSNPTVEGADQAFIDSAVNARVDELRIEMMMQNDSIINVLAQQRADSILDAMASKKTGTKRAPKRKVISRDKGTISTGGGETKDNAKPVVTPNTNTGKTGDQSSGTNTGKTGNQSGGTNTGKR